MIRHNNYNLIQRSLIVLAIFVATSFGVLYAQSVQSGIVYEYDGQDEKKPLANVEIVVNNAGSTVSDANGKFTLIFRTLKPGDKITIRRCEKIGYEIFNTEAVAQLVITRNNDPITIVMCKSEIIKQRRDQYTNIARQRYAAQMEQEEKVLKSNVAKGYMSMKEYERRIKEIKMNFEEQLEDIENYIERFSHIDLTEISDVDKQVIEMITSGDIDEAIRLYDEQNLMTTYRTEINDYKALTDAENRLAQAAEQKKADLETLKNTIHRHIDLLYLAGGKENFEKVVSLLHEVAEANPDDMDAQLEYGDIAFQTENTAEAMKYYNRAYAIANGNVVNEAMVQIKRGAAFYKMNNLDKSWNESMTALHNLDSVNAVFSDSDMFLLPRATSQITLANIYNKRGEHTEAMRYFSYAVEEYKVLIDMDSASNIQGYADLLMLYGKELAIINDTLQAEIQMKKAVAVFENLQSLSPQKNSGTLAYAYCWLGDLYRQQKKFDLAEDYLLKSASLYEYARTVYPDLYLSQYAECLQTLGKLYTWTKDYTKAIEYLDKADINYNKLAERNPDMYTDKVGEVHINMGTVHWYLEDYSTAAYYDSIAVKRYEELYKLGGDLFNFELGQSLFYLGDCYFLMGDYVGASRCYSRATKYYDDPEYADRIKQARRLADSKSAPKTPPALAPKVKTNNTQQNNKKRKA